MSYELLIWDFNGTILDDVKTGIDAINAMLERRRLPLLTSPEAYRRVFRFPIIDYYRAIGLDMEKESFETLAGEWVTEYNRRMDDIPLVRGIRETLAEIRRRGIPQIILSSSEIGVLRCQLDAYGITPYFSEILGLDNIYAGGKIELAKHWQAGRQQKALLVGDTPHDYETAAVLGCDCLLYAGGHGSRETLAACRVPVLESVSEVLLHL